MPALRLVMVLGVLLSGWAAAGGHALSSPANAAARTLGPGPSPVVWLDHGRGTPCVAESRRGRPSGGNDPDDAGVVSETPAVRIGAASWRSGVGPARRAVRAAPGTRTSRGPPLDRRSDACAGGDPAFAR